MMFKKEFRLLMFRTDMFATARRGKKVWNVQTEPEGVCPKLYKGTARGEV